MKTVQKRVYKKRFVEDIKSAGFEANIIEFIRKYEHGINPNWIQSFSAELGIRFPLRQF